MYTTPLPWPDTSLLVYPAWVGLSPTLQIVFFLGVCLLPPVLLVLLYRYEMRLVSTLTALLLLGLRLCGPALFLALVCLQPIYAHEQRFETPGRILVFVDRSGSMDVSDPQRQPLDALRHALVFKLARDIASDDWLSRWIEDLAAKRPLRLLRSAEEK